MGIGVVMDIVHSNTVQIVNEGLNYLDGSECQYFHSGGRGEHPAWDSKLFDYGKPEVMQFLLSNIRYWMEDFHFDGFRFDGVTSMMYHHHGFGVEFGSQVNYFREGVEWDALTYLQLANNLIHAINPSALSIAEDVSGMPGIGSPIDDGGLGFDYRLGMGLPDYWVKMLDKSQDDFWSMDEMWNVMCGRTPETKTIGYCESHDQALVGDKTIAFRLMDKEMYYCMSKNCQNLIVDRGIALHKMIRLVTAAAGGHAYLNFMGNEFGHPEWIDFPREGNGWSYKYARRQWSLRDNPDLRYEYLADFDEEMIRVIVENNVLMVGYPDKLDTHNEYKVLIFKRNNIIFVFNFHPTMSLTDYEFNNPVEGDFKIILNTDSPKFGGHGRVDENLTYSTFKANDNDSPKMKLYIPNRSGLVLKLIDHN